MSEKSTQKKKVETLTSVAFSEKFARHCKKQKTSVAERLRDLMVSDMKK